MQRIELGSLDHVVERQWQSSGGAVIRVGRSGDRWFAWHSRKGAAWVFQFERSMCDTADQWLARGEWREVAVVPAAAVT